MNSSERHKKHVGYASSVNKDPKLDGYMLKYLNNKPFSSKAIIPRRGLPGNKDGKRVCISLKRNLRKKDGLLLEKGWVRYYFVLESGKLKWHPIHTEITTNNTGKMMHETVKEAMEGEMGKLCWSLLFAESYCIHRCKGRRSCVP